MENLKKIINPLEVEIAIIQHKSFTDNELDILYLAYYYLKSKHLKYDRRKFGRINDVEYEPRKIKIEEIGWGGVSTITTYSGNLSYSSGYYTTSSPYVYSTNTYYDNYTNVL